MARQPNVVLWTVECLFPGQTEYTVTTDNNPHHLQLRGKDRIWVKENLINIAVQRCLPRDWKYMAWVDGDLLFHDKHIAEKTINALQVHPVVQMWEEASFLGPKGEVLETNKSFGFYSQHCNTVSPKADFDKAYPHPGFAWAIRRDAFDFLGELPEFSVVGNADNHFAYALIRKVGCSYPEAAKDYVSRGYLRRLTLLEKRLELLASELCGNGKHLPGYVRCDISHMWHGDWRDRKYVLRWQCLFVGDTLFDPDTDLIKNSQGVVELRSEVFKQGIEEYFSSRREDSKDVVTDHANKHRNAPRLPPVVVAAVNDQPQYGKATFKELGMKPARKKPDSNPPKRRSGGPKLDMQTFGNHANPWWEGVSSSSSSNSSMSSIGGGHCILSHPNAHHEPPSIHHETVDGTGCHDIFSSAHNAYC
eukprot:TRINITY_DN8048_c0_g1_i2.p1 TRINITY_DN8048_c0_g1~~TRINITY_DN8048_c0_g1_i2.p1  ORF type:complete len:486 (+),score=88.59 TRINITY_DN8048_c0_g1_i2:202-1458(+)